MINFYFDSDERKHIFELQLVHMQLHNVRKNMGAHATYAVFRAALELLKMLEEDPEEGSDGKEQAALEWTGDDAGPSCVETALGGTAGAASDAFEAKLASLESLISNMEAEHKTNEALNTEAQNKKSDALKMELEANFKARSEAQDAEMSLMKSKMFAMEAQLARLDPPSSESRGVARTLI
jgi:hypothetical protein